jgi:uncharacterized ion transporter superfamily protein YfcC
MEQTKKTKKKFSINMLIFILGILICASLLTYLIPAGQFDTNPDTKSLIPGTFHLVEQTPVNPWKALLNIFTGMTSSAKVMSIVIFMGGALRVIISTGAVEEFLNWAIYKLEKKGIAVIVPLMVVLFSVLSAYGGNDSFFAFTVIGVAVAAKMGLDPIAGMAMTYFATSVGFAGALKGRTLVAQGIADVTPYSGAGYRTVWLFIMTGLAVAYALWYCFRVKKDPGKSLMGNSDWMKSNTASNLNEEKFNPVSLLVIIITAGSFILNAIMGVLKGWNYPEQVAVLLIASTVCGLLYKKTPSEIADTFAKGCQSMGFVAFIIGLGGAISQTLTQGNILHTMVNTVTMPLMNLHRGIGTIFMFWFNWLFNFFIISGSGQAAVVMPIMNPIADALQIERQVAVSAFVYGDAYTNMLFPTSASLLGALAIAGVPLKNWVKFVLPFLLVLSVLTSVFLYYLTAIGWTGL